MNNLYQSPNTALWKGRNSSSKLYVHEKIQCMDLNNTNITTFGCQTTAILGYSCDEGVKRNQGRVGAKNAPDAIRKNLAKYANHFPENQHIFDVGNVHCDGKDLEYAHQVTEKQIFKLLSLNMFPIVLGGGHDLAYPHYRAIRSYLPKHKKIGIINLDAHFDLRTKINQANSGTPFYQIATEPELGSFHYLCLGIQRHANTTELFRTAEKLGVEYMTNENYVISNWVVICEKISHFIKSVDYVYLTIDLDGFASAMGVSAVSPFGFSWDVVCATIKQIKASNKLISADIVELNPLYDLDFYTAKLGAGIVYSLI